MQRRRALHCLAFALLFVGLAEPLYAQQELTDGENTDAAASDRAAASDTAAEVKRIFRSHCLECHGDKRSAAGLHLLKRDTYIGADGSVVPGDVDGSFLFDYVASEDEDFRMPEPPRQPLSKSEVETIRTWITAGAAPFPNDVEPPTDPGNDPALSRVTGAEYVLDEMLQFIKTKPREDRPFLRFFSSNHLLTAGATANELTDNRHALSKAVNHLSWQPEVVAPVVVDQAETIFAVDIRDYGWQAKPFSATEGGRTRSSNFDLYDQVLLEYPYGLVFESSNTFDELFDVYLEKAELIRPIPYVRIDWFVSRATQSPLYEDMLQLPQTLSELEAMLGVDGEENLMTFVAKRAGTTESGVSRNNRIVERHPARYGAYWKSYDFSNNRGLQNMFTDPIDFNYAGGEMIWNLPNGLQGYLITDNIGNRILEAPTSIVTDKFSDDHVVRNGLACMRCHDRGIKTFDDSIRSAFEPLSDSPGVNRRDILRLYPPKEKMDALMAKDEKRFQSSMLTALGEKRSREPLVPVVQQYLEKALSLELIAGELGLKDSAGLETVFKLPQFARLGLAGLGSGGVIRRDTWEDYFDRVATQLGLGSPVSAVDALSRPDHLADALASGLQIRTNKPGNVFSPGEMMVITVDNNTGKGLFVEMIGTGTLGEKARLTDGVVEVHDGASLRFPTSGELVIKPQLGTEFITVFTSTARFEPGAILRGKHTSDRVVHSFYQYDVAGARLLQLPAQLIKKTLKIETR